MYNIIMTNIKNGNNNKVIIRVQGYMPISYIHLRLTVTEDKNTGLW